MKREKMIIYIRVTSGLNGVSIKKLDECLENFQEDKNERKVMEKVNGNK